MTSARRPLMQGAAAIAIAALWTGCSLNHQAKPASLAGESPTEVTLTGDERGRFSVHELQMHREGADTVITGHLGPAVRETHRPRGHVDVQVISPTGEVVATGSGPLDAIGTSPRVPTEGRFRIPVRGHIPPGCEVKVEYHASVDGPH